ncbi:hypothetical protein NLX83_32720 [Allokutzneria sp. A3M-2-11 16]|uniref:TIM-barrel domain-containing protein n=1 Tax=Allokutzneria sp. A3M-2-11 16 TaxID=2962043 RepID=UPI0020B785A2|nr:TIM-barrel domain-containing protein [Allokutzneria sp. A3M-2-11 16]MCP3804045.1 hypothetical protein [Allokutzneria sp. A3M-2-11 16]
MAVSGAVTFAMPLSAEAAKSPLVVRAGALTAEISARPWQITFKDAGGRVVLAEHSVGALGFRAEGHWWRAKEVRSTRRSGGGLELRVASTHPNREMTVSVAPDADGVIKVAASVDGASPDSYGVSFRAADGERYLGFGERANAVDQRGNTVENYVSDGPWQDAEYPAIAAYVPPWGLRERADATYYPVPWLLSSKGYGVLVDNAETSYFKLGDPKAWSAEVTGKPDGETTAAPVPSPRSFGFRVFAGPRPADALARFTKATGRQPSPAAPWLFGPWVQATGDQHQQAAQLRKLQQADAPVSVAQTYGHYLPGGVDRAAERERFARLHAMGLAATTYFNPMVDVKYGKAYGPIARAGGFTSGADGKPYVYRYGVTNYDVSQIDFRTEAGRQAYKGLLAEAIEDGADGWMEDFGEYTPLDGRNDHNSYPREYHCAANEFSAQAGRPIVRFVRSGWTGSARCSPVVWGGDPTTGWGFDGLRGALHSGLNMGTSGVGLWGSDIGGYFALGPNALTPELLTRWVQLGAVSGVMRTQAEGTAVPAKERPQVFDDGQIGNWRRYAKLRTQLYPYLAGAAADYERSGMPLMRHLALAYPDDPRAVARTDEFLFGPDILAAPVLQEGQRDRALHVPRGEWIDLWRSVSYQENTGGLSLGAVAPVRGGQETTLPAPLDQLPLLVRAGAVLPLLPPEVDSLYNLATDEMRLLAFPNRTSSAKLGNDGELRSTEAQGAWTMSLTSRHERTYSLQASMATLERPIVPCAVTLDGKELPSWSYDAKSRVLTAQFRVDTGTLRVAGCR